MAARKSKIRCDYDLSEIRRHMALSVVEKLDHLEKLNIFYHTVTPARSKRVWEKLKAAGKI